MRPLRAQDLRFLCGHGVASDAPRWEKLAQKVPRETPGHVAVGVGILLGGTLRGAVQQAEGGHEVSAERQGRGGTVGPCRSEPSVHLSRRAVERAEELLQQVVAELSREVPQLELVLEELVHAGPPWLVLAGTSPEQKISVHSAPAEGHGATQSALSPGGRCRATSCTAWW